MAIGVGCIYVFADANVSNIDRQQFSDVRVEKTAAYADFIYLLITKTKVIKNVIASYTAPTNSSASTYHSETIFRDFHVAQTKRKTNASELYVNFKFSYQKISDNLRQNPAGRKIMSHQTNEACWRKICCTVTVTPLTMLFQHKLQRR